MQLRYILNFAFGINRHCMHNDALHLCFWFNELKMEMWLWNASAVSAGMETQQLQSYIFKLQKNRINQICRAAWPPPSSEWLRLMLRSWGLLWTQLHYNLFDLSTCLEAGLLPVKWLS